MASAPSAVLPDSREWSALAPHPATITWQRAGDARLMLAAGYALVLQVSHPTVGAGVSEHSQFRSEPWGRLLRTLDYTNTMVFAGPQAAGEMGRRMRAFHQRISGTLPDGARYHALEPEPYAWVHATLAEAIVSAHARFGRPFNGRQREVFWAEWRALGRLIGVRERDLPDSWAGFRDYFAVMVGSRLEHTPAVDEVLDALAAPTRPPLPAPIVPLWALARPPLTRVLRLGTVGLLPAVLRRRFAIRWTSADEAALRALGVTLRVGTPLMPGWLLNMGPGYLRARQAALARGDAAAAR